MSVEGGSAALAHIDRLSKRYLGRSHHTTVLQDRIMLYIRPDRVVWARAGTISAGEIDPHRFDHAGDAMSLVSFDSASESGTFSRNVKGKPPSFQNRHTGRDT